MASSAILEPPVGRPAVEQPPAQQPTIEMPNKAEQKSSVMEQVKMLRSDVRASLKKATAIRNRIDAIEANAGTSSALETIKRQNRDVFDQIQALTDRMVDVLSQNEAIEPVQQKAKEVAEQIKSIGAPLFEESKREAQEMNEQRQDRSIAFQESIASAAETPLKPEAPAGESVEEGPKEADAQPAEGVEAAPAEQPETELPAPTAEAISEEAAGSPEAYNRPAAWAEIKNTLADRAIAKEMKKDIEGQLSAIDQELAAIRSRIESADRGGETPEQLIALIGDIQTQLGGPARAEEIQAKLRKWMTVPEERAIFDHRLGKAFFVEMKTITGNEGLVRSIRLAKERAAGLGKMEGFAEKMKSIAGYSEVQQLESRKKTLDAQLSVAIDKFVGRMQDENRGKALQERRAPLATADETLSVQIDLDEDLASDVEHGDRIEKERQLVLTRLKTFTLDLPPGARDLLADTLPNTIPSEAAAHMTAQQRSTYEALIRQHEELSERINNWVDQTRDLFSGGIVEHRKRLAQEQDQGRRQAVSESLEAASDALQEDFSPKVAGEPLGQTRPHRQENPATYKELFDETSDLILKEINEIHEIPKDSLASFVSLRLNESLYDLVEDIYATMDIDPKNTDALAAARKQRDTLLEEFRSRMNGPEGVLRPLDEIADKETTPRITKEDWKQLSKEVQAAAAEREMKTKETWPKFYQSLDRFIDASAASIEDADTEGNEAIDELRAMLSGREDITAFTDSERSKVLGLLLGVYESANDEPFEGSSTGIGAKEIATMSAELGLPVTSEAASESLSEKDKAFYTHAGEILRFTKEWLKDLDEDHRKLLRHPYDPKVIQSLEKLVDGKIPLSELKESDKQQAIKQAINLYELVNEKAFDPAAQKDIAAWEIKNMAEALNIPLSPRKTRPERGSPVNRQRPRNERGGKVSKGARGQGSRIQGRSRNTGPR